MEKGHSQQNSSALARGQGHTSITDRDTDRQQTAPTPRCLTSRQWEPAKHPRIRMSSASEGPHYLYPPTLLQ